MAEIRHSVCALDCPDCCSLVLTVQDGHATRLRGNPEHPVTRGFLCGKVAQYLEREYHPERLLYPRRRVGAKGAGGVGSSPRGGARGTPPRRPPARGGRRAGSIRGGAGGPKARGASNASRGTKRWTPSPDACARWRTSSARKPSCPIATGARWGCSTAAEWIGVSFTGWAPRGSTAPSARRPAAWG